MIESPVANEDPRMIAWNKYKSTDAYANSLKWALARQYEDGRPISAEQCVSNAEGSLWTAFIAGCAAIREECAKIAESKYGDRHCDALDIARAIREAGL